MSVFVSVVIPTYGRADSLTETIESVLAQTYKDYEVIIVDDNSPESPARAATSEMMKQYADDDRIVYICHEKNKNGAAARNTGIKAARGEYIAFLDDDDKFLPDKLQVQVDFVKEHPEIGGVYGWHIEKGIEIKSEDDGNLIPKLLMCENMAQTSTLMLRRDRLLEMGGFNENYRRHQDIEMLVRFCKNNELVPIPQVVSESGWSGGMNNLHCEQLEILKDNFINDFSEEIANQPLEIQKKIYCRNYSAVWADYLHRKRVSDSWRIYSKWAKKYPLAFTGECMKRIFKHLRVLPTLLKQKGQ